MTDFATSGKNFNYFRKQVIYWVKALGLTNYNISVVHEELEGITSDNDDISDALALVRWDIGNRHATVYLNKIWHNRVTNKELDRCAFHEVCHILLAEYSYCAREKERIVTDAFIKMVDHAVIVRLENLIMGVGE